MKTAEQVINRIVLTGFDFPEAIKLIKQYANYVATQALKDAAENAEVFTPNTIPPFFYGVKKESITKTKIETP